MRFSTALILDVSGLVLFRLLLFSLQIFLFALLFSLSRLMGKVLAQAVSGSVLALV